MSNNDIEKTLLNDHRVIEEINRHLWFESEKAGYDIGFDKAKEDWLKRFSKAWMSYHMPKIKTNARKNSPKKIERQKKRRAKSYIK